MNLFYEVADSVDLFIELFFGVAQFMTGGFLDRGDHPGTDVAFIADVGGLMNDVEEPGVFQCCEVMGATRKGL